MLMEFIFIRLVRELIHWAWIHPTTQDFTGLYRMKLIQLHGYTSIYRCIILQRM